jgi:site-specific DNA-methyltransferase (adenine-specific)
LKPYYETDNGKLFCCDNVKYLNTVRDNTFDLTVTSPPYDKMRDYKGYTWNYKKLAKELYRITKDGGVVVWVVGDQTINGSETGTSFKQALYFKEIGFNLHDTMIYEKAGTGACGSNKCYWQAFEYMFVFVKGKIKTYNLIEDVVNLSAGKVKTNSARRKPTGEHKQEERKKGKPFSRRTNIWRYPVGVDTRREKALKEHPAIFPEQLAKDHIISWSNEGDTVFDPFMGSGTTAKMCEKSNRKWVGCEISEEYCKIAKQRVKNEREQLKPSFI